MQAKTKRAKYVMTYIRENTNINEHRRVIVKLNDKNILKSAYRDTCMLFYKEPLYREPTCSTVRVSSVV